MPHPPGPPEPREPAQLAPAQPAPTEAADTAPAVGGKARWVAAVKLGVGLGIVAALVWQAAASDTLPKFFDGEADPRWLVAAIALAGASVALSMVRWSLVTRAAGAPLGVRDALRVGALGYAANFVALGNVGGDVVRAALVAERSPGGRGVAVSTVLVDRLLGLFALLVFASVASLAMAGRWDDTPAAVRVLRHSTLAVTLAAAVAAPLGLATSGPLKRWLGGSSWLGVLRPIAELAARYRAGAAWLVAALATGLVSDSLYVASFVAVARGAPVPTPAVAEHYFAVPLAMIAGALPISPNGLGTFEAAIEMLYRSLGGYPPAPAGAGTMVALGHRAATLVVALLAAGYFLASRGKKGRASA